MDDFVSLNRQQMAAVVTSLSPGDRVCAKGVWHTVRTVAWPIMETGQPAIAFEDGGGCVGSAIDAVRNASGTYATYAPGAMPPDGES